MNKRYLLVAIFPVLAILLSLNIGAGANIFSIFSGPDDVLTEESVFDQPVDVVWSGEVIAVMSGGSCLGLEGNFDGHPQLIACLADTSSDDLSSLSGEVTITGKWLGVTCAYQNTIFGECVPDVEIGAIN